MIDYMANLKAYLSFVPLFTFLLLSSHVLTHELPEAHKHSYNDEGNNLHHPTLSQDLERYGGRGSGMSNRMSLHRNDFQWTESSSPPIAKRLHRGDFQWADPPPPEFKSLYRNDFQWAQPPPELKGLRRNDFQWAQSPPELKSLHRNDFQWAQSPPELKSLHHHNDFQWAQSPPELKSLHRSDFQWAPHHDARPDYNTRLIYYHPLAAKSNHQIDYHRNGFQSAQHPDTQPDYYTHSIDYHPPVAKSVHQIDSIDYHRNDFQGAQHPDAQPDYYTHSKKPNNYEDGTAMRHRKMMKPSEIDWSSFHVFPAKTSTITSGKTGDNNGVPRKEEEVDEQTMN